MQPLEPPQFYSLRDFESFGDVAAEDDPVLDYFLSTDAVKRIKNNEILLVLGRKGTGKTAIVRYFTEGSETSMSQSLNLRSYPWNVHATRMDRGASDIEAYVASWRYLIAVKIATLVLSNPKQYPSVEQRALDGFLKENYGGVDPGAAEILRPSRLRLGRLSLKPSFAGFSLAELELSRTSNDQRFGFELNRVSDALFSCSTAIASALHIGALSLHFDELDQGLSALDEQRAKMLIGLILAAREVKRSTQSTQVQLSPVIYLRTDLWDELMFSDKNKISRTSTINLEWSSESLAELVNTRLRVKLTPSARWVNIAEPGLMRGSQTKWNHLLARTFKRPRDVIAFLNSTLKLAKTRKSEPLVLINQDIVASREEYSRYLKQELDDEIGPHWPKWEEALQACSAMSTITFERSQFEREYELRRSAANPANAPEALSQLYKFSVIGYEKRSGYGGVRWAFQYTDPEAGWDNAADRLTVHLGLKEYAKLRESRG